MLKRKEGKKKKKGKTLERAQTGSGGGGGGIDARLVILSVLYDTTLYILHCAYLGR